MDLCRYFALWSAVHVCLPSIAISASVLHHTIYQPGSRPGSFLWLLTSSETLSGKVECRSASVCVGGCGPFSAAQAEGLLGFVHTYIQNRMGQPHNSLPVMDKNGQRATESWSSLRSLTLARPAAAQQSLQTRCFNTCWLATFETQERGPYWPRACELPGRAQ